jgi:limonene-1,2-epoxide hydrolase
MEELVAYFVDDGIYHNMPADPVRGPEALTGFIGAFTSGWNKTDWEILNLLAAWRDYLDMTNYIKALS